MDQKPIEAKDAISLYENGKSRRYGLLFAVNGGAFAIGKLLEDRGPVGGLSAGMVAFGMIIFNLVMIVDIFSFGFWCRYRFKQDVFGPVGWSVLGLIGILLCAAWMFAIQRIDSGVMQGLIILLVIIGVETALVFAIEGLTRKRFQ